MKIMQNGVDVLILPESAKCLADDEKRSPSDIDDCPIGCEICEGDCYYYDE